MGGLQDPGRSHLGEHGHRRLRAEGGRIHDAAAQDLGQAPAEADQDHGPEARCVVDADDDRAEAAKYPDGDLLRILYTQHADVTDLLDQVEAASGAARKSLFTQLTTSLKAHETAEESVVRPVTKKTAGADIADARNAEEAEANEVIATLSKLDVDGDDFDTEFAKFKQAVADHAEAEEHEEFPTIEAGRTAEERHALGDEFRTAFKAAGGTG